MIVQHLSGSDQWRRITPLLEKAVSYLRTTDFSLLPAGRQEIDGEDMFAVVQRYLTADASSLLFEQHRRYVDVQYMVSGRENIFLCHSRDVNKIAIPYEEAGDIIFYQDPAVQPSRLQLTPGSYTVFFPEDCHKTRCSIRPGDPEAICKVIVKIRL